MAWEEEDEILVPKHAAMKMGSGLENRVIKEKEIFRLGKAIHSQDSGRALL